MPKQKISTAKSRAVRAPRQVTIAFQRTFVDGPLTGLTVHGLTAKVSPAEAAGMIYSGKVWGHDSRGNARLDRYIRMIHPKTHKLLLENYELRMEYADLIGKYMECEQQSRRRAA
jgi:hypothetical protein